MSLFIEIYLSNNVTKDDWNKLMYLIIKKIKIKKWKNNKYNVKIVYKCIRIKCI